MTRHCKACRKPSQGKWCKRCGTIKARFSLDPKKVQDLLEAQGNRCRICGKVPTSRSLALDHDHTNGQVRGFLCTRCNMGLGYLPTPELLRAALEYLKATPTGLVCPIRKEDYTPLIVETLAIPNMGLRAKARILAEKWHIGVDAAMSRIRRHKGAETEGLVGVSADLSPTPSIRA